MKRKKVRQMLSGLMAATVFMSTSLSFSTVNAMEEMITEEVIDEERPPLYEDVKDKLSEEETVKAEDLELEYGSVFDLILDFSNMEIPDNDAVKITFKEAKNENGDDFSTWVPDTYKAVYYVEPLKTDHPVYQISRNLIVREEGVKVERTPITVITDSMVDESTVMEVSEAGDIYDSSTYQENIMPEPEEMGWLTDYLLQAEYLPAEMEIGQPEPEEPELSSDSLNTENEEIENTVFVPEETENVYFEDDTVIIEQQNFNEETGMELPEIETAVTTEIIDVIEMEPVQVTIEEQEVYSVETIGGQGVPTSEPTINIEEIAGENAIETERPEENPVEIVSELPTQEPEIQAEDIVTGTVSVYKKGEILKDYADGEFIYEDGFLDGAVFEVVAMETIYTSDFRKDDAGNRIVQFQKGELAATMTTDKSGKAVAENLPLGVYEIREKTAPVGYVQNLKTEIVEMKDTDSEDKEILEEVVFTGERQKVKLTAVEQNMENDAPVDGALLALYSADDIQNADGKTILTANTLIEKAVTGEDGKARFQADIPCGNYHVKELEAADGFVEANGTVYFEAAYQGQELSEIRIEKSMKTGVTVIALSAEDEKTGTKLDGAVLQVLDQDGNVLNEITANKENAVQIKKLEPGKEYTLREKLAPYGYLRAEDITFNVENTAELQEITIKQEVPTALLIINKKGEFLENVKLSDQKKDTEKYEFSYTSGKLSQVSFQVYAAEDITAADGISEAYYKKDDLVSTIETDEKGIARAEMLHVGKYYVVETAVPDAYAVDMEPRYIDLSYRDQDTPVVTYSEEWQNIRKRAEISVTAKEKDSDRVLEGGVFQLLTAEDIHSAKGKVLLKKDTVIESGISNQSGKVVFHANLPVDCTYYITEVTAPKGFVRTDEVKKFFAGNGNSSDNVISHDFLFEHEKTAVELKKIDTVTGENIIGASMRLAEENGEIIYEWNSGEESVKLYELTVDKVYRMTEVKPAGGYATAKDILFTVQNTPEVQAVEMSSDVTRIQIRNTNVSQEKDISGADLCVLDQNDQVVKKWASSETAFLIEKLPVGFYTLREEKAPAGYIISADVSFEVKDTADMQYVLMENKTAKGKLILNLIDAENEEPLKGAEFELRDSSGKTLESLKTDAAGHAESSLYEINQKYYLKETKAVSGYLADTTEYEITFAYKDQYTPIIEVVKNLTNREGAGTSGSGTGLFKNPETGDESMLWEAVVTVILTGFIILIIITGKKKKKEY